MIQINGGVYYVHGSEHSASQMSSVPKLMYSFNANFIKIYARLFGR